MTETIDSGRKHTFFQSWAASLFVLLLAVGATLLIRQMASDDEDLVLFPEIALHAESAAYGDDGFTVGSTLLEEDLDGFFFLDGLTGELKVIVINPRTHKFMAEFSRKIVDDFNLEKEVKNPRFMVVTGLADMVEKDASLRWAESVFYVLERNSGKVACYGLRYPPNLRSTDSKYSGTLVGLDTALLRKTRIRDKK